MDETDAKTRLLEMNRVRCRRWQAANKEKANALCRAYYQANKEKRQEDHKRWYHENHAHAIEASRRRRLANPDRFKANWQRYYQENAERLRERSNEYRIAHKEEVRRKLTVYYLSRRRTDPQFKLRTTLRTSINTVLRKYGDGQKAAQTEVLLGCTVEELRLHLEARFAPGMMWSNHGRHGWHIDHIRPCSCFDLTDPAQQRACFHWSNLQPLWAADNIRKGAHVGQSA